ncbi:MAG: hypothetical protein HS111_06715 [Kofleriaceae bacterium]|nr:hypothetical protein [Kofleriaceae bacterium]MCL4223809.1 hypothetical protein [Myxococcales bacterium]
MSITTWYFVRTESGQLEGVARAAVEAFALRDGRLKTGEDGFVRYAEVLLEVDQRSPVRVLGTRFSQWRANADGSRNAEHTLEVMRAAVALLPETDTPPAGVIAAEAAFARRRLDHLNTWQPTPDDTARLRELVNAKAQRDLM